MSEPIRLGISTCPNDTFAFHAILTESVDLEGLRFETELLDVEELNEGMRAGRFDVSKVSFHAALAAAAGPRPWCVLPSGSALGFGVGPLLLAKKDYTAGDAPPRVLCPGEWTTATLLWRLFHPEPVQLEQCVFSDIMPALQRGEADLGVCIHEGRFTWRDSGLDFVEDLGTVWEERAGAALPLGGIVASADLDADTLERVKRVVRTSIEWGLEHRDACLPTMRRHAQESSDEVLWAHVDLYVNDWTVELGDVGRGALDALGRLARERGLLPEGAELHVA